MSAWESGARWMEREKKGGDKLALFLLIIFEHFITNSVPSRIFTSLYSRAPARGDRNMPAERQHRPQAVGQEWGHQMEMGHQGTAPCSPMSTEPDGPLIFAGSSPADVEFARIFWSTAILPPLFESSLGPTNLQREGASPGQTPSSGWTPAHRWAPSAAHSVQEDEAKEKYRLQAKKKEEILALLRKQREERVAVRLVPSGYALTPLGHVPGVPRAGRRCLKQSARIERQ
ncbi:UPF0722 protein C11orf88 homolog isoform X2 [Numida meleagris]|uniref:UPF0722 protein C11orf88 homolog isoform X2 n=1 Tax=Numida meleagris TaxID=8996 RepID=UPI000B3E1404|nr:UPF0722 protein C11orf88 homolog isoform X2 [Numida meleagris]